MLGAYELIWQQTKLVPTKAIWFISTLCLYAIEGWHEQDQMRRNINHLEY
ncbi:hypothetical protein [[Phormidium ambiguum] IAM M-71]|nr:hypothetical protein [Phormidium ambiguum]